MAWVSVKTAMPRTDIAARPLTHDCRRASGAPWLASQYVSAVSQKIVDRELPNPSRISPWPSTELKINAPCASRANGVNTRTEDAEGVRCRRRQAIQPYSALTHKVTSNSGDIRKNGIWFQPAPL